MTTTTFPTLYSQNSDGTINTWALSVSKNVITKDYGKLNGKIQSVSETIAEGKRIGKKNETTPAQQALLEATSQWEKKLKKGYTKELASAEAGEVDSEFVTGGIEPMLANKFTEHQKKIVYPAYSQPKLDGIRCIAMVTNGVCKLWTRTRKPITGVPHIISILEKAFPDKTVVLDGELYNHAFKTNFETIVSFVRQETPKEGHEVVQYHVYDLIDSDTLMPFEKRTQKLEKLVNKDIAHKSVILVSTRKVESIEDLMLNFTEDRKIGYEGTMVRNAKSIYEMKRSYHLQKIKSFDDAEFEIIGVQGGRGRMAECAIFVCRTKKGGEFTCKMEGSLELLKPYLLHPETVIGKQLTVRYQGFTNGDLPRFPIGISIRDYE